MIILGNQKDYYDHMVAVFGRDELVVYDRRKCFPIDPTKNWGGNERRLYPCNCSDYQNSNIEIWFKKEPIYSDKKRQVIKKWSTRKVLNYRKHEKETEGMGWNKKFKFDNEEILEGQVYHFVLEIGYHHYLFEVERYLDDNDETKVHLNYDLIEKKRIEKDEKISYEPMCLTTVGYQKHNWMFKDDFFALTSDAKENKIDNPILFRTYIPKFISPEEVWNNLYEYISSLRDKEIVDTRTNEQHIESHGFDRKISFRHRKN